ncbi:MAG: hypothetical protein QW667_01680 [Candidatus Bathyarchaeia archaeon]
MESAGAWDKIVDCTKTYLNYDRHYVMLGEKVIPDEGTNVIWHVDHMPYNLFYYLEFLNSMKEKDKQKTAYNNTIKYSNDSNGPGRS